MINLRDYQAAAVDGIRQSFRTQHKAPLLVLPTGGGKTVIFTYIAASTSSKGKRVLILVHRVELLRQTSAALAKFGVDHGLINPQFTPDIRSKVQVASVQTLVRRLDRYTQVFTPDLIVVDEAHHANASTWRNILQAWPTALVLGVTATPIRGDGSGLGQEVGGMFDDLIVGPQVPELIAKGFLVRPIVFAPATRLDLTGVKVVRGDYDNKQLAERVDKPKITGDAVDHYKRLCPGAPAVVFCVSILHAEHVAEEFRAAGYRAYAVDGSMDDDQRKRILNGLASGSVQVVASCDLISEGTDIPAIGCAILLRPTQSMGLYIQQVGRALRPASGKQAAYILDHVGNVLTHGMPDELREWSLEGETKKKRGKKKEEPTLRVRQCEQCFAVHAPAPRCPQCGFVYVPEDRRSDKEDGQLTQVTPEQAAAIRKAKNKEVAQAKTLEDLERIAAARGYKPGWSQHIMKAREKKEGIRPGE